MNWKKLQTLQCPSCYADLSSNLLGYICTKACGFQIGKRKFDSVVESLYKKKRPAQSDDEAFDAAFDKQMERDFEETDDYDNSSDLNY